MPAAGETSAKFLGGLPSCRGGKISGRGNTGLNVIYETHKNALYTGIGLILGFYILAEILLRA